MGGRVATTQEKLRLATTSEIYGQRPLPSISRIVTVLNISVTNFIKFHCIFCTSQGNGLGG